MSGDYKTENSRCPASRVNVDTFSALQQVLRSKAIEENPHVSTGNYLCPNKLAQVNVDEFMEGSLVMINGDEHRQRRRLLNSLVRPEQLQTYREEIILPSIERWLTRSVKQNEKGQYACDMAQVVELIFLEFAAKIIGLQNVESQDRMARLRSCALPIFGALSSAHFEDREAVINAGLEAKRILVEEFYRPSLAHVRAQLARVEAGEIKDEDVPLNLLKMIATEANPDYADEETAIHEVVLFFVATTGTSVQAVLATIDNLLKWFEKNPEDRERIDDMDFISRALQETLRLRAPFVSYITRLSREDLEVEGIKIHAGDEIHGWVARAGKDPQVFGEDAQEFNPWREVPKDVARYGLAFATGLHQCLGLRAVLGNDGKSGSHMRMVQKLFWSGIRRDPDCEPKVLEMKQGDEARDDIPTYISYPVILDNWSSVV